MDALTFPIKPLVCDPARLKGLSPRLIQSHYDNNYSGAVKRLNAVSAQLAELDLFDRAGLRHQRTARRENALCGPIRVRQAAGRSAYRA